MSGPPSAGYADDDRQDAAVMSGHTVAEQALRFFKRLYDVERQLQELSVEERLQRRRSEAKPMADLLHDWLLQQRALAPSGSATARAIQTAWAAGRR
jgi:hypothetical protein